MTPEPRFLRVLARRDVLALAFGAMIGWGWVVLAGTWLLRGGVFGAVAGFLIAGAALSVIALLYAELAAAMPSVGGEHVWSFRALGTAGSFVCTWSLILAYVSVAAFEAVALPTVIEYLVPGFRQGFLWTVAGYDVHFTWVLAGIAGAAVITALNCYGIRLAGSFQSVATLFIFLGGAGLLAAALDHGSVSNLEPAFVDGAAGIAAVAVMAPFLLFGFDVVPQAAEEIDLPPRALGAIIFIAVVAAALWYALLVFLIGFLLDGDARRAAELPAADAAGGWLRYVVLAGGIAGLLTSWNAFVVGGSRVIYALAESGMLPAALARLHPVYRTPVNAILLIGFLSAIAPWFGRTTLVWIANAGSFGIVIAYLLVGVSFVVLRIREPGMHRPFRLRMGLPVGLLGCVLAGGLALLYLPGSPAALAPVEWGVVAAWSVLGAVLCLGARRNGSAAAPHARDPA
jgi:amino acid transporter